MSIQPDAGTTDEARSLIASGRVIDAVKLVRERTGASLVDAKQWVDMQRGGAAPAASDHPPVDLDAIEQMLYDGRVIEAIKAYRTAAGCDLKEAKESIDAHEKALRAEFPGRFKSPRRAGCASMVVVAVLVGVLIAIAL